MDLRMTFVPDRSAVTVTCLACGNVAVVPFADLHWLPPAAIEARAEHPCQAPAKLDSPVTPRPAPDAEGRERVRAFLENTTLSDREGVITLAELLDAYGNATGEWPDSGIFSRRLRAVLPPGTAIRREMIDGVRARRVIGVRWR